MVGLTRGTTPAHIARAALEGIAFQVADVLDAMEADAGIPLKELRVDGGARANNLLMQFQADLLGVPVVRPDGDGDDGAGRGIPGGAGGGLLGISGRRSRPVAGRSRFEPAMPRAAANTLRQRWTDALGRSKGWEKGIEN